MNASTQVSPQSARTASGGPAAHQDSAASIASLNRSDVPANRLEELTEPLLRGASATTSQVKLRPDLLSPDDSSSLGRPASSLNPKDFGEGENVVRLQPVDTGFGAWSYVASAFLMYIVVWGFPQAFPIFQTHLSTGSSAKYPGSLILPFLAPGLQDIQEGILFSILPQSVRFTSLIVITGISMMTAALLLASYATTPWQIVLTQGVLFGFGGVMLNFVHVSAFSTWFDKNRNKAMGIVWLGYRLGALAFPIICQWLLRAHGFEETLRVLIAPMLTLLVPSVFLLRGRYSKATVISKPAAPPVSKITVLRKPSILVFLLACTLFDLVQNVPTMFISTYASDIGMEPSDQALALSLVRLSSMLGTYLSGWYIDEHNYYFLRIVSPLSTAIVHATVLGFAKTKVAIFSYAILVGFTSGGADNAVFPFYSKYAGQSEELFTAIHGLFSFCAGMGTLSVGPVGVAWLNMAPSLQTEAYAIGKYQYLVAYTAGISATSGLVSLGHYYVFGSAEPSRG